MYNQTDDDDFFTPSNSSNLATLFNNPTITSEGFNQSLMYTAPRQPKTEDKSSKQVSQKPKVVSSVISAKPVTLSKLVDEKYSTVGKYGLALIGSDAAKVYEIIVYKDAQNVLVRIKVSDKFRFIIQNDNFATFFDDQKQNWLVRFDDVDASKDFTQALEEREIKVDRSLKNNRNTIAKHETNPRVSLQEKHEDQSVNTLQLVDDTEKLCDTQSDSSGTQTRANILSRMAKMGQQILPRQLVKDSVSDLSDTDTDVEKINKKSIRKVKRTHSNDRDRLLNPDNKDNKEISKGYKNTTPEDNTNYTIIANTSNFSQPYAITNSNIVPVTKLPSENQIVISQQEVHPAMDHLNLFFNENRVQNNELKLNMAQISLKLEQVLFELQQSKSTTFSSGVDSAQSKIKALELQATNLNQELTNARECISKCATYENEIKRMNNIIKEKDEKIDSLTKKSDQEHSQEIDRFKQQIKCNEELVAELQTIVENQKLKIENCEKLLNEKKSDTDLQENINELTATISNLKMKLKDFEEYYKINESNKSEIRKQESNRANNFTEKLKLTMNLMFHNVIESFKSDTDDATFQGSFIASVLAQNIKATTYKIIEEFEKDFKVSVVNEEVRLFHTENSNTVHLESNSLQT